MTASDHAALHAAIHDLVSRYADAVNRRDESAWAATWADSGEWQILGRSGRGRDAVVELWHSFMKTVPFVYQTPGAGIVERRGEGATGRWYITEHARGVDGSGMFMIGHYQDEYALESGEWRFARRRFDPMYMGPPDMSGKPMEVPPEATEA